MPRLEGARLIEGHLYANSFWGKCSWPLKGGACLIEVAATTGGTVHMSGIMKEIIFGVSD